MVGKGKTKSSQPFAAREKQTFFKMSIKNENFISDKLISYLRINILNWVLLGKSQINHNILEALPNSTAKKGLNHSSSSY